MPCEFQPDKMYRMPTHFGPSLGPRQSDAGRRWPRPNSTQTTIISVRFLSERCQLEALLPAGFQVAEEPIVTVSARYMTDIPWLAGRGYNTLGVLFPAIYHGQRDHVRGEFLTVLWENLADPIITGREELGYAKLYCELPESTQQEGETRCLAAWLGFEFLDLRINRLRPAEGEEISATGGNSAGMLHYKYIPRTGEWGTADVAYATLTPAGDAKRRVTEAWAGEGSVQFHPAAWEDLPTMYNIVNALHALEVNAYLGATLIKTVGAKDLSDQRRLY